MSTIQFFHQGIEMTTRHELALKYPHVKYNRLQRLLERKDMQRVEYKNHYYFEKASTEQLIEARLPAPAAPTAWASESMEFLISGNQVTDEERLERAHAALLALENTPAPVAGNDTTNEDFFS